jgi:nanoRNase/pAp phosphatase (c-di-AMP/oligoRNAs hydrolase)
LLRYTTTIHIPTGIYTISGELAFNEKDKKKHACGKVGRDISYDLIARRLNSGGHRYAAAGVIRKNEVRKQLLT